MIRPLIWRSLGWRLFASLLLVLPLAALVAASFVTETEPGHRRDGYLEHLDATWFRLPGACVVFLPVAVLLAAGRAFIRHHDHAYLLALPVSRHRWLLSQLGAAVAALGMLVGLVHLIFSLGAWWAAAPLAAGPLAARSLAVWSAAAVWAAVTLGVLALVRRPTLAALLVLVPAAVLPPISFRLQLPAVSPSERLPAWDPWAFVDPRAWQSGIPVVSLLLALTLGLAGVLIALHRASRIEP